jgi:hypothetical protein
MNRIFVTHGKGKRPTYFGLLAGDPVPFDIVETGAGYFPLT